MSSVTTSPGAEVMWTTTVPSPVGPLHLRAAGDHLTGVFFDSGAHPPDRRAWRHDEGPFRSAKEQLDEYFSGRRRQFDLAVRSAGTPFQQRVWAALRAIPYGSTASYAAIATEVGNPLAVRAVGLANGRNPLSIVVPCHRVIGAGGGLTGYGGGLATKRWLLEHEGALPATLG